MHPRPSYCLSSTFFELLHLIMLLIEQFQRFLTCFSSVKKLELCDSCLTFANRFIMWMDSEEGSDAIWNIFYPKYGRLYINMGISWEKEMGMLQNERKSRRVVLRVRSINCWQQLWAEREMFDWRIRSHIYSAYISMEEESSGQLFPLPADWEVPDSASQPPLPSLPIRTRPVSDLSDLAAARQRFLDFAGSLGALRGSAVRRDVLQYAAGGFKNERVREESFEYGCILRNIELRIEKMRKTRKIKKNWGEDDLKILVWVVSKYAHRHAIPDPENTLQEQDWAFVASLIPGVTAESCRFKWLGLRKVTLARHSWTAEESQLLRGLVARRSVPRHCSEIKDWKAISQQLYHLHTGAGKCYRNAKQCREHWTCYLSPKLKKGPWTRQEDLKLFRFIFNNRGSKRWSEIAKQFNGRTENALKNRFTLLIDKQRRLHRRSASEMDLIREFLDQTELAEFMRPDYQEDDDGQDAPSDPKEIEIEEGRDKTKDEYESEGRAEPEPVGAPIEPIGAPIRVERIALKDFESFGLDFWRALQPGIMESNGQFRKASRKETQSGEAEGSGEGSEGLLFQPAGFALNSFCSEEFMREYDEFDELMAMAPHRP